MKIYTVVKITAFDVSVCSFKTLEAAKEYADRTVGNITIYEQVLGYELVTKVKI